ncbi:MAG: hypothetical protein WBH86_05135 [Thermogutta sp.]
MSRVRLRRPDHPLPLQFFLALIEFLASLRLAVTLLTLLILVLAVATFIETSYGAAAARFAVYRAWWFTLLGGLLAINILFAAIVRFPWKRHQTGFVITHAGILVLLAGAYWTALEGIDAQLSIYEGMIGHIAYQDTVHFEIDLTKKSRSPNQDNPSAGSTENAADSRPSERRALRVAVPFHCGPFNWCDYSSGLRHLLWSPPGRLPVLPWQLAWRDKGVIFTEGDLSLEVLDYYADSRRVRGGYLAGYIKANTATSAQGTWFRPWEPIELDVQSRRTEAGITTAIGSRVTLSHGVRVVLTAARSQAELDGFLLGTPVEPLDHEGQVVLVHNQIRYVLPVRQLRAATGDTPLEGSGLRITHFEKDVPLQAVQLQLKNDEGVEDEVILFADLPEFNRQGQKLAVAGAYWVNFPSLLSDVGQAVRLHPRATTGATRARVDLCQGPGGKLYYRIWQSPQVLKTGEINRDDRESILLVGNDLDVRLVVNTFVPWDPEHPEAETVVPLPFRKGARMTQPRVKVRLSAGGKTHETWLAVLPRGADRPIDAEEIATVASDTEQMRVTVKYDAVDVGFRLKLREFQRKLDPGTNQPSYYASLVDLYVPERIAKEHGFENPRWKDQTIIDPSDGEPLQLVHPRILITLNHPANIVDPITGRSYRLYQESFSGPFRPGDPIYEQVVGKEKGPPELYLSTLSVNYDPGRGLKYAGSLLIIGGIVLMYLMRVYIFRPRVRPPFRNEQLEQSVAAGPVSVT